MPAKSKQQFKLMKMVEKGEIKLPGLSKKEAAEYTKDNTGKLAFKNLPDKVKFNKLKKVLKG
jgi:hypothetical protein